MSFEKMEIDKIRVDMGTQTRASMDPESVKTYAEALKADPNCRPDSDPVVVFRGATGENVLASGFHWLAAARLAGVKELRVKVEKAKENAVREALLYAFGTNEAHGLRLTNADKRHKIKMMLSDPVWKKRSNAWVAQQCRVSDHTVEEVRKATEAANGSTSQTRGSEKRTGRDNKTRSGKKAAQKNGQQAAYDWKGFSAAWGALVREIDKFGNVHKAKDTPEANGLRRKLEEWKKDFRAWFKAVTKQKPPEE